MEEQSMNKRIISPVFGAALVATLWLSAGPIQTGAAQTAFTATSATCSITPGVQSVSGNVLHVRGEVDAKQIASSETLVAGSGKVVVNLNVNLADGSGGGWGTLSLQPAGVNGGWDGTFSGSLTAGVFSGQLVAQGTGALAGMELKAAFQGLAVPQNQLCAPGPDLDEDNISGIILEHGGG
jgi:type 1 fimbria pilin